MRLIILLRLFYFQFQYANIVELLLWNCELIFLELFLYQGDLLYIYDKKTNTEFYQPIHPKIKNIVFNLEGFDFDYNHIYYVFNLMKKDLKLDKQITIHTLRHTFCSTLNEKGVPVTVIRELANHRNIQTTMNYTHTKKEQCRQALNVL